MSATKNKNRVTTSLRLRMDIKKLAQKGAEKRHRSFCNYIEYLILEDNKAFPYPISENTPNSETLESMEQTQRGEGISNVDMTSYETFCKSLED